MKDDSTLGGELEVVDEVAGEEVVDSAPDDKRNALIDDIAERREQAILEEAGNVDDGPVIEPETEEVVQKEDSEERMVLVKVDGEEIEVPESEVIKNYQKGAAADKRLNEVAQQRKDFEEEKRLYMEQQAELQKEEPEKEQLPDDADFYSQVGKDISYGSDEETAKAVNKIVDKAVSKLLEGRDKPTTSLDQNQIVAEVRQQMEYDQAKREFESEYDDLLTDERTMVLVGQELEKTFPVSQTYPEAFKSAGDNIRKWLGKEPNGMEDKLKRKQSMVKEPSKTSARAEVPPTPPEPTTSDLIAEMRKGRGQP